MTEIGIYKDKDILTGFCVKGHSTANGDDENGRLVCSAVSSAAYLTANTLIEVVGARVDATVDDGKMDVKLLDRFAESQITLKGFCIHIEGLAGQYPDKLKIITEV